MVQNSKAMELAAALKEMVKSRKGNLQVCDEAANELHRLSLLVTASNSLEALHALVDETVALKTYVDYFKAKAEIPNWPRNATEVRDFMGSHAHRAQYARDDHIPDDGDTYTLSAHDFLSAVYWWADVLPKPGIQKFTVLVARYGTDHSFSDTGYLAHVQATSIDDAKQLAKAKACLCDNPGESAITANPDDYRVLLVVAGTHEALF